MPDRSWDSTIDLGYLVRRYHATAVEVVTYGVDLVAKRSQRVIPRRTGRTAATESHGVHADTARGYVAYHGSKAAALHENLTDRHRRGRAKFLETELTGSAGAIRRRAVAEFRAATQGGAR